MYLDNLQKPIEFRSYYVKGQDHRIRFSDFFWLFNTLWTTKLGFAFQFCYTKNYFSSEISAIINNNFQIDYKRSPIFLKRYIIITSAF